MKTTLRTTLFWIPSTGALAVWCGLLLGVGGGCHPDVKIIDGVPHRAVYKDCMACERKGYTMQQCPTCNGEGQAMFPCPPGILVSTPQGPIQQPCPQCGGSGQVLRSCPKEVQVNCRPCWGTGRVFVKYEPIPQGD